MLNNFVLALGLTGALYWYNNSQGTFMTNIEYLVALTAFTLGIGLLYKFILPKGTATPSVLRFIGLEKPSNGPNGEPVAPCYNVPFKVINTQYGDKAVLAGYNENVQAYETGATGKFESPQRNTRTECSTLGYNEEQLSAN